MDNNETKGLNAQAILYPALLGGEDQANTLHLSTTEEDCKRNVSKDIPSVFVPKRDEESEDMKELRRSAIVILDRTKDTYICVHNVVHAVADRLNIPPVDIKWRPYNDNKFLFTFDNKTIRDELAKKHSTTFLPEAIVKCKAFQLNESNDRHPMKLRVWLTVRGLPVQYLTFKSAQLVASRFGKLYACNGAKRHTYVGAYNFMVDCTDIKDIPPYMDLYFEDEGKTPLEITKDYACTVEAYNEMNFEESEMNYEDAIYTLLEQNKMTNFN